jgi:hypothetical protein
MLRRIVVVGALGALLWGARAQAVVTEPAPQVYLPIAVNPVTPTPTRTPTLVPTATATPTATPVLPPPAFVSCGTPPASPASAPDYPVRIVTVDKAAETVTLQNVSSQTVMLDGWHMCSIHGGQSHPISGGLAPGQTIAYPNAGGPIWNNIDSDPGALWTPDGRLASYWPN